MLERIRLRFRIRSLLVALAVSSVLLGLALFPAKRQAAAVRKIFAMRGSSSDTPIGDSLSDPILFNYGTNSKGNPTIAWAFREYLGQAFGIDLFGVPIIAQLEGLNFDDDDVHLLAQLSTLQHVNLAGTRVSNVSLESLRRCKQIEFLGLKGTSINDEGLVCLLALPRLRSLNLRNTALTDGAYNTLSQLRLERLWLGGTNISEACYADLQQAMPECKIQPPGGWPPASTL